MEENKMQVICTGYGTNEKGCNERYEVDASSLSLKVIDMTVIPDSIFVPMTMGCETTCPYCGAKTIVPIINREESFKLSLGKRK